MSAAKVLGLRPEDVPSWLEVAAAELDVTETPGPLATDRIAEYLATVGEGPDDETAWCSAFVEWCMRAAGHPGPGKPNARAWIGWGHPGAYSPRPGAVTVLWRERPDSWKGHVGFFVRSDAKRVCLIGGNQGNRVCQAWYPRERVLTYRWPE